MTKPIKIAREMVKGARKAAKKAGTTKFTDAGDGHPKIVKKRTK